MDISGMWRTLRPASSAMPRAGAGSEAAVGGITISVEQQCQAALPVSSGITVDLVTATVTSQRPGIAAQVSIGANFNSADGSYQGPTTAVGQGEFTATSSQTQATFVVARAVGWPVLGVGAEATWADGAPGSPALTYVEIACDPFVWWQWLVRILAVVGRPFSARATVPARR